MLERAIKDLIEEFRSFELLLQIKKGYTGLQVFIRKNRSRDRRLADSSSGESKITLAIQMANQGKSVSEISEATNLSLKVEPLLSIMKV